MNDSAYSTNRGFVLEGDCRILLKQMVDEGLVVQSVVCDPPYNLSQGNVSRGFMGKHWDNAIAFNPEVWRLCLELLSPGGHLVAFGGTRTYHRLACAIEDAGFEIRDQLAWVSGQGFPKSMNVGNAIDKAARGVPQGGHNPTSVNHGKYKGGSGMDAGPGQFMATQGEKDDRELVSEAQPWISWGTALKPAWEPIVLARKSLIDTVAQNVLTYSTGAINIDACRIPIDEAIDDPRLGGKGTWGTAKMAKTVYEGGYAGIKTGSSPIGRFPANLAHDGSQEVLDAFAWFGNRGGGDRRGDCRGRRPSGFGDIGHDKGDGEPNAPVYADSGSPARFFTVPRPIRANVMEANMSR